MKRKIAIFFTYLLSWTSAMVFYRYISGQEVNAINLGILIVLGVIVALFMALVIHTPGKSRE
jgi:hypothetical protein